MTVHNLVQGSPEWHQFRLEHFGASEAAAMLGLSKHVRRSELLRMKHTGDAKQFSDWFQQNVLDNGHAVEAAARPMAEAIIGDEIYPATHSEGRLSASCDGLTMSGGIAFEHKQWNAELAAAVRTGKLPDEHQPQCQQVMMVTGADRLLFMVSDGTPSNCVHMWVEPDTDWRKRILQGWTQFAEDLANYRHVEIPPAPVAAAIEALPALLVQVEGRVLATNLEPFKQKAMAFLANIKTDLNTDQDFTDADKMAAFLKDGEDRLDAVKEQALAQTASIYELFSTIDYLREEMRAKRLDLGRKVDARKKSIRAEILAAGEASMRAHIDGLNKRIGRPYMPDQKWADFAGVMKNKRTVASLRDAVDTELARAKIAANEIADRIQVNMASLTELASDYKSLFADTAQLVLKANDDLVALVKLRIADHKESEANKAEQARIKKEQEDARAAAAFFAQAGVDAPAVAAVIAQSGAEPQVTTRVSAFIPPVAPIAAQATTARPTDDQIIGVLAKHYHVHESKVIEWLMDVDLRAASERMAKEFVA